MNSILPLHEDWINRHIGQQICVVLHDGTCFNGTLSNVKAGELVFRDYAQGNAQHLNENTAYFAWIGKGIGDLAAIPLTAVSGMYTAFDIRASDNPVRV